MWSWQRAVSSTLKTTNITFVLTVVSNMYRVLLKKNLGCSFSRTVWKLPSIMEFWWTRIGSKVQMIAVGPTLNTTRFDGPCLRKRCLNDAFFQHGLWTQVVFRYLSILPLFTACEHRWCSGACLYYPCSQPVNTGGVQIPVYTTLVHSLCSVYWALVSFVTPYMSNIHFKIPGNGQTDRAWCR